MPTLEEGLVSYLSGYAGLTALISTRVYVLDKPQGVSYPCVTFQRVDTPRIHTHDMSGGTGTLAHPRIQFDAWAVTYAAAKAITDQLRAALNGKTGSIGSGANIVTIRAALVDGENPTKDETLNMYRSQSDFIIWQEE
jgi:hypothetical protein